MWGLRLSQSGSFVNLASTCRRLHSSSTHRENTPIITSKRALSRDSMKGAKRAQVLVAVFLPPLLLSLAFIFRFLYLSPPMSTLPSGPYPGDGIIPDAVMVYDQTKLVNAAPADVWPWVLQVGKGRAGSFTPCTLLDSTRAEYRTIYRVVHPAELGEISAQKLPRQSIYQPRVAAVETRRPSRRLRVQR